ncbi:exodeoxyribonuclease V subunit beta [Candidatus Electronema sp. JC]|uniref:exodeoxyribonuclease V subunit beta n=1 Tax=Candidatus Electronema sp. JC TaxID=3401570 RepID=UPI003AA995CE
MRPLDPLTLPLRGQILIEASAGTGKTYTIAQLFLRLLLEQELAVDEILVVTFTKAAAEELRGRIRQRIRDGLDALERGAADDQNLAALLAQAGDAEKAAALLRDALARMDESAICTIHSFCRRMLQEHAFESGAPFEMELTDSEGLLRLRIIEDFWRQRFYPAPPEEAAWALAQWRSPEGLLAALGRHWEREDVDCLPLINATELDVQTVALGQLFAGLQRVWQQCREEIAELLRSSPRLLRDNKKSYGQERLTEVLAILERLLTAPEWPQTMAKGLELFTVSMVAACLNKKKGEPPDHPFLHHFEQFLNDHSRLMNGRRVALLLEARHFLRDELARRRQEQSQLSFDDLQSWLDKGLRAEAGEVLAKRIARRFPVILVDEFQDTDPLQYRIFKTIHAAAQARTAGLFLIGDPKQAIYSFRGAEIFTYLRAKRDTKPQNRLTMTVNHRSSTAMVEAVNALFAVDAPFGFAKEEIDFPHVRAAGRQDVHALRLDGQPHPAMTCLLLEESDKPLAKAAADEQAARRCAAEIAALLAAGQAGRARLGEEPLAAGDIAVLVRTNEQAELIRQELNAAGIASVCGDKDYVFAAKEAQQLLRLLACLCDLSDLALARTVLAGGLFGWTAEQIDRLREDDQAREAVMEMFARCRKTWLEQGFLPMFQQLLSEQRTVRRLHSAPSGERTLTNYLHLAELIQEASRQQHGPDALLRWFSDQMRQPEGQSEAQQLRLESDENLVRIVTVHKAKGMEYPLVFLPFLWTCHPCDGGKPFSFHRPEQPERLCLDLGTGSEENLALAERERLSEDLRLLYVAMTRSAQACFFCWGRVSGMEDSAFFYLLQQSGEEAMQRLGRVATLRPWQALTTLPKQGPAAVPEQPLCPAHFSGRIDSDWRIVSYSSLTAGQRESSPEQPDHDAVQTEGQSAAAAECNAFTFPRGAAAGTCLHGILEQISFTDPAGREEIIRAGLERAGFASGQWLSAVAAWLEDVLHTPLAEQDGSFSLSRLKDSERVNEMAFHFTLEQLRLEQFNRTLAAFGVPPLPESGGSLNGLMTGFIDLVFCWQGKYYLADYKSNHLGSRAEDYSPERLDAAMLEHRYDLQYLIYTVALRRFLAGRIRDYSYERHFGGAFYLFLRGMRPDSGGAGVHAVKPPLALVEGLDKCCGRS